MLLASIDLELALSICNTISDLGAEIDNVLSFEIHIHNMVSTANGVSISLKDVFSQNM